MAPAVDTVSSSPSLSGIAASVRRWPPARRASGGRAARRSERRLRGSFVHREHRRHTVDLECQVAGDREVHTLRREPTLAGLLGVIDLLRLPRSAEADADPIGFGSGSNPEKRSKLVS